MTDETIYAYTEPMPRKPGLYVGYLNIRKVGEKYFLTVRNHFCTSTEIEVPYDVLRDMAQEVLIRVHGHPPAAPEDAEGVRP